MKVFSNKKIVITEVLYKDTKYIRYEYNGKSCTIAIDDKQLLKIAELWHKGIYPYYEDGEIKPLTDEDAMEVCYGLPVLITEVPRKIVYYDDTDTYIYPMRNIILTYVKSLRPFYSVCRVQSTDKTFNAITVEKLTRNDIREPAVVIGIIGSENEELVIKKVSSDVARALI